MPKVTDRDSTDVTQEAARSLWLQRQPMWLLLPVLCVGYWAIARLSLHLAFAATSVSPVWPPSGFALAAVLLFGRRAAWAVVLGAFTANLDNLLLHEVQIGPATLLACIGIALGNSAEALLGAELVRRWCNGTHLVVRFQDGFRLAGIAFIAAAASAAVGTCCLVAAGIAPRIAGPQVLATWWVGDAGGILTVTPFLTAWLRSTQGPAPVRWLRLAAFAVTLAALCVIASDVFDYPPSVLVCVIFLFIPCIGWAAYAHGMRGVSLTTITVSATMVWATIQGRGPFADSDLNTALFTLECFLTLWSVSGLVMVGDLRERRGAGWPVRSETFMPWLALLTGTALSVGLWFMVESTVRTAAQAILRQEAEHLARQLRTRVSDYAQVLRAGAALFAVAPDATRDDWHHYVERLRVGEALPGAKGVGYAAVVPETARGAFEQHMRADGTLPNFMIRPSAGRSRSVAIAFLEPPDWRNQRAYGFDMYSEPVRRGAIDLAIDSGEVVVSGRVTLMQETTRDVQAGFLMYAPVYRMGAPVASTAERRAAIVGLVFCPFRAADFVHAVLGEDNDSKSFVEVFDGDVPQRAALLHAAAEAGTPTGLSHTLVAIDLPRHRWTLRVSSTRAFAEAVDHQKAQVVLLAGFAVSLLLFALLRMLLLMRRRSVQLADEMSRSLHEAEARLSSLAATAHQAIILADERGAITHWNPGAEQLFGHPAAAVVGDSMGRIVKEGAAREMFSGLLERATADIGRGAVTSEFDAIDRDGHDKPVSMSLSAWRGPHGVSFGAILSDLTQRRSAEAAIESARSAAEQANQMKSAFLANMGHEIRTPLNAILGFASLLRDTPLNVQQRDYVNTVHTAGDGLLELINDLLDFSKIEADKLELENVVFDLRALFQQAHSLVAQRARAKQLTLSTQITDDVPQHVRGDPQRLQQILLNLLNNAIKFTERGAVTTHASAVVQQAHRKHTIKLLVEVKDTGIGVSEALRARLFRPFTQADASITRRYGGTGLGLSISRRLAESMGGTVELADSNGPGATFRFEVQLESEPAAASTPVALELPSDARPPIAAANDTSTVTVQASLPIEHTYRVLLAEDNPVNQKLAVIMLQKLGCEVDVVNDGRAAVQSVLRVSYDLVFMDCQMPELDGFEATRQIRALAGSAASTPIVALTAGALKDDADLCKAAGMNAFLAKPVRATELQAALRAWARASSDNTQQPRASSK